MNTLEKIPKQPITVPVELDERFPTDEETAEAMRRAGMTAIDGKMLQDMKTVGVYVHGAGTFKLMRGSTMITHQRLDGAMRLIYEQLNKVSTLREEKRINRMTKLAQVLGYLSARQVEVQKLLVSLEGVKPGKIGTEEPERSQQSFTPGTDVKPGQTLIMARNVHMHGTEAPSTAK